MTSSSRPGSGPAPDDSCTKGGCFRHHRARSRPDVNPFGTIQRFCLRSLARSCTKCDTAGVVKVAFIGAGSVKFTRNVVTDLCGFPELADGLDLALHDITTERLAHAHALATRIVVQ